MWERKTHSHPQLQVTMVPPQAVVEEAEQAIVQSVALLKLVVTVATEQMVE